jgi:hypothetical protein
MPNWDKFDIKPTSLWGTGCTTASETAGEKYMTMKHMMLQHPHVVSKTVGGDATIKFGKAGGVATGAWWEAGVKTNGDFQIAREYDIDNGGVLLKSNGGMDIGKKATQPPGVVAAVAAAVAAGTPIVENPDINVTPIGNGSFNVFRPLNVFSDNGISWIKNDFTQGIVIGSIGPGATGIASVGSKENQNITVVPRGTGSFIVTNGNLRQGIGIETNNITALSNNANQDINVIPKGTGSLNVNGNLTINNGGVLNGPNWRIDKPDDWVRLRNRNDGYHINFAANNIYAHGDLFHKGTNMQDLLNLRARVKIHGPYSNLPNGGSQAIDFPREGSKGYFIAICVETGKITIITYSGGNNYSTIAGRFNQSGFDFAENTGERTKIWHHWMGGQTAYVIAHWFD